MLISIIIPACKQEKTIFRPYKTVNSNLSFTLKEALFNHEIFSKALLELFPEFLIEQDSSFLKIRSDIKHLINNHNIINKNKQSLFKVYYNVNNENKNSILFFDKEADVKSYSYVLRSLDGLVVYLNI